MGRENNSRPKTEITENVKITKQRLREIREKNRYTQKEIAKDLNISRSYVSRIEKRATTKILREFLKENKI